MNTLTRNFALSVSLIASAHAYAANDIVLPPCQGENFSARADISKFGTGKLHLQNNSEDQFPHSFEGLLEGTFNKQALSDFMQNYCENGTISFDETLTRSNMPLRKIKLNSADNTKSVNIANRINGTSEFTILNTEWPETYKQSAHDSNIRFSSIEPFILNGQKPAL